MSDPPREQLPECEVVLLSHSSRASQDGVQRRTAHLRASSRSHFVSLSPSLIPLHAMSSEDTPIATVEDVGTAAPAEATPAVEAVVVPASQPVVVEETQPRAPIASSTPAPQSSEFAHAALKK